MGKMPRHRSYVQVGGNGGMDRARVRDEVSPGEIYEHPSRGGG